MRIPLVRAALVACILGVAALAPARADECGRLVQHYNEVKDRGLREFAVSFNPLADGPRLCEFFKKEIAHTQDLIRLMTQTERACGTRLTADCRSDCLQKQLAQSEKSRSKTCNPDYTKYYHACADYGSSLRVPPGNPRDQQKALDALSLCNQSPDPNWCQDAVKEIRADGKTPAKELTCDGKPIAAPVGAASVDYDEACIKLSMAFLMDTKDDIPALTKTCSVHPRKDTCEMVNQMAGGYKRKMPAPLTCMGR